MARIVLVACLLALLAVGQSSSVEKLKKRVQALAEEETEVHMTSQARANACARTADGRFYDQHFTAFRYSCPSDGARKCASEWNQISTNCAGSEQSPIDLEPWDVNRLRSLDPSSLRMEFNYHAFTIGDSHIWNDGSTVELCVPQGPRAPENWVSVFLPGINGGRGGKVKYNLERFHFHTPSEHTVAGVNAEAELHLVHMLASPQPWITETREQLLARPGFRKALVLGYMFYRGPENAFLKKLINFDATSSSSNLPRLPTEAELEHHAPTGTRTADFTVFSRGAPTNPVATIHPGTDLLDRTTRRRWWNYKGSLTTPTCDQVVDWFVNADALTISPAQLTQLRNALPAGDEISFDGASVRHNNRPTVTVDAARRATVKAILLPA